MLRMLMTHTAKGYLFYKNCLFIPRDSSLKQVLLKEFHDVKIGWNAGVARTFHLLSSNFYVRAVRCAIRIYTRFLPICQHSNDVNWLRAGLLQPLLI